jgi:S-adenosylmethionine hydrolase
MARRYDTVSLLTDYGSDDEFVGVVKSVLRDLAPHATAIDLTHGVRPFDVRGGSLTLARAIPYVAEGVILAVVDPGVGTSRRAVAIEVVGGAGVLVGPDNGLLAPAVAVAGGAERVVELTNPVYQLEAPGSTFAGRDVFAPAAAHLCNGIDLAELGPAVDPFSLLPGMVPLPRQEDDGIHAEVLWVDRFGNCQLNVGPDDLPPEVDTWRVVVGGETRVAHVETAFGNLGVGSVGLVVDSQGVYALVLDRRSAAAELGIGVGDAAVLSPIDDDGGAPGPAVTTRVDLRGPPPRRR